MPAILHMNLGHWTVLVRTDGERYLLRDPGLGGEVWVTRDALATEWSGFALVPAQAHAGRWRVVSEEAARAVVGQSVCPPGGPSPDSPPCPSPTGQCCTSPANAGGGNGGAGGGSGRRAAAAAAPVVRVQGWPVTPSMPSTPVS